MKIQSSWIFLEHPSKQKHDTITDDNTQLDLEHSLYSFIEKAFPFADRVENPSGVFSSQLTGTFNNCNIELDLRGVGHTQYLDISVEGETEHDIIDCLEQLQDSLFLSGIRKYYVDINAYDAVSEHYCNMIVGYLNSFERNLRKLLFNTYVLYFRENYYTATMVDVLQSKIKQRIGSTVTKEEEDRIRQDYGVTGKTAAAIIRLKYFFESLEYFELEEFLFEDHCTASDRSEKEEFLRTHADLSKLTDKELRAAFDRFSPKSDWNRFFEKKVHVENMKNSLGTIREYRNSVAHFKHFSKDDYVDCLKHVQELNTAVLEAIEETKSVDFANKNRDIIKQTLEPYLEKWMSMDKSIRSYFEKTLHNAFRDTIDKLKNPPESTDDKDNQ